MSVETPGVIFSDPIALPRGDESTVLVTSTLIRATSAGLSTVTISIPTSTPVATIPPTPSLSASTDLTSLTPSSTTSIQVIDAASTSLNGEEVTLPLQVSTVMFAEEPITVDSEGVIISSGPTSSPSIPGSTDSGQGPEPFTDPAVAESSALASSPQIKPTATIFTTVGPSTLLPDPISTNGSWVEMPSMAASTQHLVPPSNILNRRHPLFALGIVLVSLGGILALLTGFWLYFRISRRRRRLRRDQIISFSPASNITPYAFDSKTYNHDIRDVESAYTGTFDFSANPTANLNLTHHGHGNTSNRDGSRQVPSFYHDATTGVASTVPRINVEYLQTTRGSGSDGDHGFDTFNCAMYPSGTCPEAYENRTKTLVVANPNAGRGGSPVPSFQTGRLDETTTTTGLPYATPIAVPTTTPAPVGSSRVLTPPRVRHIPPPLIFSPSINGWTNSVRGFTPRRSHTTTSSSTVSSSPSLYAPERV